MEGITSGDPSLLIIELMNCQDNARQLEHHLESHVHQACPTSPGCKSMVQSILDSMDKSISMVKACGPAEQPAAPVAGTEDSPTSGGGSPVGRSSRQVFRDQKRRELSKRRKALSKWTRQVQVCPTMSPEGPVEDEYSWRKYGQKDILGTTYPRAYYRCTHQRTLGCLATKYVQRSDKDPKVFHVTYRGEHTCRQRQVGAMVGGDHHHHTAEDLFQSPGTGVGVGAEEEPITFCSMPTEEPRASDTHIFSMDGSHAFHTGGNSDFAPFISPATSESNYFQVSTFQGDRHVVPSPIVDDVELTEMMLAATSISSSAVVDMDFN